MQLKLTKVYVEYSFQLLYKHSAYNVHHHMGAIIKRTRVVVIELCITAHYTQCVSVDQLVKQLNQIFDID